MNRKLYIVMGFLFPLILLFFAAANIIAHDKEFSDEENRCLVQAPSFTLSTYIDGRFERRMENYSEDQFIARNLFIKVKSSFELALGNNRLNGVYFGKDMYLLEDITTPEQSTITATYDALNKFRTSYPDVSASFLLAPTSANILNHNLPVFASTQNQNEYMDSFFSTIEGYGFISIDVRGPFELFKESEQLFYRTDHHWTSHGAYLAYLTIKEVLSLSNDVSYEPLTVKTDFRGTLASKSGFTNGLNDSIVIYMPTNTKAYSNSVIFYSDSKQKTTQFYVLNNLETKDMYTVFGGSNHPLYTIETPIDSDKRLLLIKDSYANSLIPFLSQDYSFIAVVDPRYFYEDISSIMDSYDITDVMFIYNANTLFNDTSLAMMMDL